MTTEITDQSAFTAVHTQQETAEMLGCSRQTVALIEKRAFEKIKKALSEDGIYTFAEAMA